MLPTQLVVGVALISMLLLLFLLACRVKCLLKFISCWLHGLDIAAAFEELADACYEKLLRRRAQVRHAAALMLCKSAEGVDVITASSPQPGRICCGVTLFAGDAAVVAAVGAGQAAAAGASGAKLLPHGGLHSTQVCAPCCFKQPPTASLRMRPSTCIAVQACACDVLVVMVAITHQSVLLLNCDVAEGVWLSGTAVC